MDSKLEDQLSPRQKLQLNELVVRGRQEGYKDALEALRGRLHCGLDEHLIEAELDNTKGKEDTNE